MLDDGYFYLALGGSSMTLVRKLAQGIRQLKAAGWPASFILMYDEAWTLADQVNEIMFLVTGNKNNLDMLAWYIDPDQGQSGFSPHRDRQPEDTKASFHVATGVDFDKQFTFAVCLRLRSGHYM